MSVLTAAAERERLDERVRVLEAEVARPSARSFRPWVALAPDDNQTR